MDPGERGQCIGRADHGLGKPELLVRRAGEKAVPWLHLRLSEVIDISPGNLDCSVCFLQPGISHDVLCI